jgi:hypothetical protein
LKDFWEKNKYRSRFSADELVFLNIGRKKQIRERSPNTLVGKPCGDLALHSWEFQN